MGQCLKYIGSTTSKSACNFVNWGGSDNNYCDIQASEMIYNCPVESLRRTYVFSRYFGPSSYKPEYKPRRL